MVVGTESGDLLQLHLGSGALLLGHKGSTVGILSRFLQFDCSKVHGLFHVRGELKSWADMFTKTVTAAYDDPAYKAGVTEDSCPRLLR
ncbi:MAG: hypothetical protein KVP17_000114 [Porospora cf. gigantea B]|nr:MAG: hypothetical protein KVP17_000114 [Porospora cf. gigantea B]